MTRGKSRCHGAACVGPFAGGWVWVSGRALPLAGTQGEERGQGELGPGLTSVLSALAGPAGASARREGRWTMKAPHHPPGAP